MKRSAWTLVLLLLLATTATAKPWDPEMREPLFRRVARVIKHIVQPPVDPVIPPRP